MRPETQAGAVDQPARSVRWPGTPGRRCAHRRFGVRGQPGAAADRRAVADRHHQDRGVEVIDDGAVDLHSQPQQRRVDGRDRRADGIAEASQVGLPEPDRVQPFLPSGSVVARIRPGAHVDPVDDDLAELVDDQVDGLGVPSSRTRAAPSGSSGMPSAGRSRCRSRGESARRWCARGRGDGRAQRRPRAGFRPRPPPRSAATRPGAGHCPAPRGCSSRPPRLRRVRAGRPRRRWRCSSPAAPASSLAITSSGSTRGTLTPSRVSPSPAGVCPHRRSPALLVISGRKSSGALAPGLLLFPGSDPVRE